MELLNAVDTGWGSRTRSLLSVGQDRQNSHNSYIKRVKILAFNMNNCLNNLILKRLQGNIQNPESSFDGQRWSYHYHWYRSMQEKLSCSHGMVPSGSSVHQVILVAKSREQRVKSVLFACYVGIHFTALDLANCCLTWGFSNQRTNVQALTSVQRFSKGRLIFLLALK